MVMIDMKTISIVSFECVRLGKNVKVKVERVNNDIRFLSCKEEPKKDVCDGCIVYNLLRVNDK